MMEDMKTIATIKKEDGQLYIELRDEDGTLIDMFPVDEIKEGQGMKHAQDNRLYTCQDCETSLRAASVVEGLVDQRLCPQCYTKRLTLKNNLDREFALINAADGMTTEEAVAFIEHGREMVEYIKTTKKLMSGISQDAISVALILDAKDLLTKMEGK